MRDRRQGLSSHPFRRAFTLCVMVVAAALVYACTIGFPDWLSEYLLGRLNTGRFALVAESVAYHPLKGLVLREGELYVKGVVGPPCLEAEEIFAAIDLVAAMRRQPALRHLSLCRGQYVPQLGRRPESERSTPEPWQADFVLDLEDFRYEGIVVRQLQCRVRGEGLTMSVDVFSATLGESSEDRNFVGRYEFDRAERSATGHIETTLDPQVLLAYVHARIPGFTERLIGYLEFPETPPRTSLDFSRSYRGDNEMSVKGQFWARDCRYRGVDVLRADGAISIESSRTMADISLSPLVIVRPEGLASLNLRSLPKQGILEYSGESSMNPHALTRMVGILSGDWFQEVRFDGQVNIDAKGVAHPREPSRSHGRVDVRSRGLGFRRLSTESCDFTVISRGRSNQIENINGSVYGGSFTGRMSVVAGTVDQPGSYSLALDVRNSDFEKVVYVLGNERDEEYTGRFSLRMQQQGPFGPDHQQRVTGSGRVKVRDGRVFMLPVFGGLSKQMAAILPGLDFVLSQGDATATYTLANGKVHSEDIAIEGDVLSLTGRGDYSLNRELEYRAQIKLMKGHPLVGKVLRLITWPISKLFEFRVTGDLASPVWYPINFSTDLFEKIGLRRGADDATDSESVPPETPGD